MYFHQNFTNRDEKASHECMLKTEKWLDKYFAKKYLVYTDSRFKNRIIKVIYWDKLLYKDCTSLPKYAV